MSRGKVLMHIKYYQLVARTTAKEQLTFTSKKIKSYNLHDIFFS